MVKFGAAIARPFTDITKLAIGTALVAVPIVSMVGSIFVAGYGLRAGQTAMQGDYKLPEWKDWLNLLKQGAVSALISIIYFLPVILLFILVAGTLIAAMFSQMPPALQTPTPTGFATAITGMVVTNPEIPGNPEDVMKQIATLLLALGGAILIVLPLFVIISYLLPAAIMGYVTENRFGAAFSFPTIFKKTFTAKWFVAWLLSGAWWLLIFIAVAVFNMVLAFIPFVGPVLSMILAGAEAYVISVTTYTLFGEAYSD